MVRSALGSDRFGRVPDATGIAAAVADRVRALGFWSAIALPLAYVPLLATGVETAEGGVAVLALLAAHLLALLVGREHRPD